MANGNQIIILLVMIMNVPMIMIILCVTMKRMNVMVIMQKITLVSQICKNGLMKQQESPDGNNGLKVLVG